MKLQNGNCQLIHELLNQTLLENNHNNWELPNGEFFNLKNALMVSRSCESLMMATPNYYDYSLGEFDLKLHGLTDSYHSAVSF